jgi:hypothetical protein
VQSANLIGQEEQDVLALLGKPSFKYGLWDRTNFEGTPDADARYFICYHYAPFNSAMAASYKVFFLDGKVVALDEFDE